jgi:hypothetical protein
VKPRALLSAAIVAALAAALAVAGCGGGGSSSGGGDDPAAMVPASAPVYVEVNLAPSSDESAAFDELVGVVAGTEDGGKLFAESLEEATLDGEKVDIEKEVEPWLGDKVGIYLAGYTGDFSEVGFLVETTDTGEAEDFIKKNRDASSKEAEFEGHKYWVAAEDGSVLGLVGDWLVLGKANSDFEAVVKVAEGEANLADSAKFKAAAEGAPSNGVGHLYVDIGGLLDETHAQISSETELGFSLVGIEPRQATLYASAIPHTGQLEIDVNSNLTSGTTAGGDASALLESLPATATGAFATAEFGKSLGESLHALSENGIPGQLAPGELEGAFGQLGVNTDALAKTFGNVAGYLEGSSKEDLGGAVVIQATDPNEARDLVTKVGLVLRASKTPGVTALGGELTGFTIRSADLGSKPLIIGAAGERVVIAYGAQPAAQALAQKGPTLGSTDDFKAAKDTLGSTPVDAFVEGRPALELVEGLLSPEELLKIEGARPYLQKIAYLGSGSQSAGKRTETKLIIGIRK